MPTDLEDFPALAEMQVLQRDKLYGLAKLELGEFVTDEFLGVLSVKDFVESVDVISVLQAKARRFLNQHMD